MLVIECVPIEISSAVVGCFKNNGGQMVRNHWFIRTETGYNSCIEEE